LHERHTGDFDFSGPQKFHSIGVPRIGGMGILIGLTGGLVIRYVDVPGELKATLLFLLSASAVLIMGILEDITKRISVKVRLVGTILAGLLAGHLLDVWIVSLQIVGIDDLVTNYFWISVLLTGIAVGGVANAFNIIDGYNGLASMVGVIILFGISYVALKVDDPLVLTYCLGLIGAIGGFLIFNYPRGLIFLGDGGAYFIGFSIAVLSILLTNRNPEVSKWFPLMLLIYPVTETLFSVMRRLVLSCDNPVNADGGHLHHLIYRKLEVWHGFRPQERSVARNSITSGYLWLIALASVVPAVIFWDTVWALRGGVVIFVLSYWWLYKSLSKG
jgi:UDP-N-acetylmuramyl pentapeptide phosphotransferase/UDP-N-acetylglucosamine-1-phosphate transferase